MIFETQTKVGLQYFPITLCICLWSHRSGLTEKTSPLTVAVVLRSIWEENEVILDPTRNQHRPNISLSLARKRVGGDGAAIVAFCG